MRQILFLAALLLLCNTGQVHAADGTLSSNAIIQTCDSCSSGKHDKCGCKQEKCGCEKKQTCGCKQEKCGCEKKQTCGCKEDKCGCEKKKKTCGCQKEKDCGCVSNEVAYGDGLAYSMVGAESVMSSGLAYTMVDMVSERIDPNCCIGETFCLLDNCTECYTLDCCPDGMRLLCKTDKCGKQKCSSCNKCASDKCGCKQDKCGCAKQKCSSKCGCS